MNKDDEKAWGDFWARQQGSEGGGCLPERWRGIVESQRAAWSRFSEQLHLEARVLDLATGDGRVLRWLLEKQPGLQATGIDLAPQLPEAPAGTTVRAGVSMEDLPFEDDSFDAVVSQFGFEYGEIAQVAKEVARVLVPAGYLGIITHRLNGPIMAHNRQRRRHIGWIFDRKNLFALARTTLAARRGAFAATPLVIAQAVQEGSQRFGEQSAAWEIAEAVRRALMLPHEVTDTEIDQIIERIAEQARNEVGRIASLERACETTDDQDGFARALGNAGFTAISVEPLHDDVSNSAFADYRLYQLGD